VEQSNLLPELRYLVIIRHQNAAAVEGAREDGCVKPHGDHELGAADGSCDLAKIIRPVPKGRPISVRHRGDDPPVNAVVVLGGRERLARQEHDVEVLVFNQAIE
jgi:hypothetical protein